MRHAFAVLSVLGLAACATGPSLDQRLSAFIGRPEAELVSAMGVPVRTYETGGRKFLEFENKRTIAQPGDPFFYGPYWRGPWIATPTTYMVTQCSITFSLREGRVEGFSFRGDGCY